MAPWSSILCMVLVSMVCVVSMVSMASMTSMVFLDPVSSMVPCFVLSTDITAFTVSMLSTEISTCFPGIQRLLRRPRFIQFTTHRHDWRPFLNLIDVHFQHKGTTHQHHTLWPHGVKQEPAIRMFHPWPVREFSSQATQGPYSIIAPDRTNKHHKGLCTLLAAIPTTASGKSRGNCSWNCVVHDDSMISAVK